MLNARICSGNCERKKMKGANFLPSHMKRKCVHSFLVQITSGWIKKIPAQKINNFNLFHRFVSPSPPREWRTNARRFKRLYDKKLFIAMCLCRATFLLKTVWFESQSGSVRMRRRNEICADFIDDFDLKWSCRCCCREALCSMNVVIIWRRSHRTAINRDRISAETINHESRHLP